MTNKHALLTVLRSYMARLDDDTHGWHPTQDKLHYALIDSRWHLMHPAVAAPKTDFLGFQELHDSLGDLSDVSSGLHVRNLLVSKRVPVLTGENADGHPMVYKGLEHDIMQGVGRNGYIHGGMKLPDTDRTGGLAKATTAPMTVQAAPLKIEWGYDSAGVWGPKAVTDKPPRSVRWSEKNTAPHASVHVNMLNPSLDRPFDTTKLGETLQPYAKVLGAERERFNNPGSAATGGSQSAAHYDSNNRYVPPRDLRTTNGGFDSEGNFDNPGFNWDRDDWRSAPDVAEYMTKMLQALGAPVVPYATSTADATRQGHKDINQITSTPFFRTPDQGIAVMPYIHQSSLLPRSAAGHLAPPGVGEYNDRLVGRLKTGESLLGAPDRHGGNYVQVPMALPDGTHTMVTHGIDYELPYQNHNSHYGIGGHGVLPYDDNQGDSDHDYDVSAPQGTALGEFSLAMMDNAGLTRQGLFSYTQLPGKAKGAVDALRSFPQASESVSAPRHAYMDERARAIARHLDPASYDHDDPDAAAAPHLYQLWNLMEGQDTAEPPVGREPFVAPVDGTAEQRAAAAAERAKPSLPGTPAPDANEEYDQRDYVFQMQAGGWKQGIGTMVDQGDSTNRRVLGNGKSYLPPLEDERVEGGMRHIQRQRDWAAANPKKTT